MVEDRGGTDFPVVFYDGERELNIGEVKIDSEMEYKRFQLMLSQKIGMSPNQITIYFVERKKNPKSPLPEERRRTLITGKVNFRFLRRQKDCCFLVVLKRSRKSRRRRERVKQDEFSDYLPEPVMGKMILLRRNQPASFYDQFTHKELADLNYRLQSQAVMRENPDLNPGPFYDSGLEPVTDFNTVNPVSSNVMMTKNENTRGFCETCVAAEKNGSTASFHLCENDAVIGQFRTRVGPISRPIKLAC